MKKVGILGGLSPESTVEYYQGIIQLYKNKLQTINNPEILINSINLYDFLKILEQKDLKKLALELINKIKVLEGGGVDFCAMASNTPHIVFDEIQQNVRVPLISIVEETRKRASALKLRKLLLLGTQFTMKSGFYQKEFLKYDIEIVIPKKEEIDFVHAIIFFELILNKIKQGTKIHLMNIIEYFIDQILIDGVILGCTELPMILSSDDFSSIRVLDTTQIHIESIVDRLIKE